MVVLLRFATAAEPGKPMRGGRGRGGAPGFFVQNATLDHFLDLRMQQYVIYDYLTGPSVVTSVTQRQLRN